MARKQNSGDDLSDKATFLMVLRVIRLARIVRIAKLSRHSRNLNTLIKTMSTSLRELSFIMLFFIVSMVLFATFVFYCEQNYESTEVIKSHLDWYKLVCLVYINPISILVGNCNNDNSWIW